MEASGGEVFRRWIKAMRVVYPTKTEEVMGRGILFFQYEYGVAGCIYVVVCMYQQKARAHKNRENSFLLVFSFSPFPLLCSLWPVVRPRAFLFRYSTLLPSQARWCLFSYFISPPPPSPDACLSPKVEIPPRTLDVSPLPIDTHTLRMDLPRLSSFRKRR